MRSPGRQGWAVANAAKAEPQPGELPPVSAISSGCALNSRAARARAVSVSARAATPASIGPRSASRSRCARIASSVPFDGSEDPAWLKWMALRVPGVAARSAATSWSVRIEVMAADDETGAARLGRRDRPARAALQG